MHFQDMIEAEERRRAAGFTMRVARRRHRRERAAGATADTFRVWARKTFNAFACAGKLARIVARKGAA